MKELFVYETAEGKAPFEEWLHHLDSSMRNIIRTRLDRLERGHFGNCEPVGGGVHELKIHVGPGFRVYFGEEHRAFIILLCGGDKGTQARDIQKAKVYWQDHRRKNEKVS